MYLGSMTETQTLPSWLSSAGVIRNGGIRPPGTEGMGTSTGTNKAKTKVKKDTSFTGGNKQTPAQIRPATTPEKPITGDRVISEGLYKFGDTMARVKVSQSSRKPYALVKNLETGEWEYTPGTVSQLKASDRISGHEAATAPSVTEGFYAYGDGVAQVLRSGRGFLYARTLYMETGEWIYAKGVVAALKPEDRLTLSQAAALGKRWHRCMCCGKELTKQESIDRGIGPICAGKL